MKFDFVIGNPPYQEETISDNKTFAPAIYHRFLEGAYQISNRVEMIHPGRFLFNAGSTPKEWNTKMLNDEHLKVLWYEQDSSKVFSGTDIKGGVVVTYHDNNKAFGAIQVFSQFQEMNSIRLKAAPLLGKDSLMNIIQNQTKFNLELLYQDYPEFSKIIGSNGKDKRFRNNIFDKISLFVDEPVSEDDIKVLGLVKNKRTWRYFPQKYVAAEGTNLYDWKVLVPSANGSGAIGEVLSTPLIGTPLIGFTQSFIGIGSFQTEYETDSAMKYVKTKFARTLLGVLKITQHNPPEKWRYVPLQDFTPSSDIDWSQSIADIDRQLYAKYGLDAQEIEFIETHVKEMT